LTPAQQVLLAALMFDTEIAKLVALADQVSQRQFLGSLTVTESTPRVVPEIRFAKTARYASRECVAPLGSKKDKSL